MRASYALVLSALAGSLMLSEAALAFSTEQAAPADANAAKFADPDKAVEDNFKFNVTGSNGANLNQPYSGSAFDAPEDSNASPVRPQPYGLGANPQPWGFSQSPIRGR